MLPSINLILWATSPLFKQNQRAKLATSHTENNQKKCRQQDNFSKYVLLRTAFDFSP